MDDSDTQERQHFWRIVRAFKAYRQYSQRKVTEREVYIKSLPANHQTLLESYKRHLGLQRVCIDHNAEIIKLILNDVERMFENVQHEPGECDEGHSNPNAASDIEKVQSTLRQIVRDWSPCGEQERAQCYGPIIAQVEQLFPGDTSNRHEVKILVPGAGLGRLAYELAKMGFNCQGNEFSLFMLFASNYVLNRCRGPNSMRVYPWIHNPSNTMQNADQLRPATFPDVDPCKLPPHSEFTMAAGDFLEIYTCEDSFDCVTTCFFIDCASNIVAFLETIYKILKPGGYWVNLGPLLYHFADQPGEPSIEPSYDEVKSIAINLGFKFTVEKTGVKTTYTQNALSLLKYEYQSVFFVAHKSGL